MKLIIKEDTTSKLIRILIQDSSESAGLGLTGLLYNSSGLTTYYIRESEASTTQIPLVTATVGTWTSGGFKEVDATNMPGIYEIGLPNTLLASGADSVLVVLRGAADMVPVYLEIQLSEVPVAMLTVAEIKAGIADGTYDLEEMIRLIFAACCAKVSGGGTDTIVFRDGPDTKNRIVETVDVNGNRTAVTLDGT